MTAPATALRSLDKARARDILARFPALSIGIFGDLMLDHFVFGRVNRISPEAPVPVVEFEREEFRVGGAANVASNGIALGADVKLAGVIGRDEYGVRMREVLKEAGIDAQGVLVDDSRPTTRKLRIVTSRNQQVARIDHEVDREVRGELEAELVRGLERLARSARALVISDYLKGAVTERIVAHAVGLSRDLRIPIVVDPKIAHLDYYKDVTVLTPNNAEAEAATHSRIRSHADASRACHALKERLRCSAVLVTRGEAGMYLLDESGEGYLPATAREVADVTGAGDTVVATLALALAAGASLGEAATLANAAAGVTVSKFGPSSLSPAELSTALGL